MPLDLLITGRIATLAGEPASAGSRRSASAPDAIAFAGLGGRAGDPGGPVTRRIALAPDEVAIPGLTDAHLHLAQAAWALRQVDLDRDPDPRGRAGQGR